MRERSVVYDKILKTVGRNLPTVLLLLSMLVTIVPSVTAQFYFGKNKVQYTDFDWHVMETEHFRIYFYEEELEIARVAADIAEAAHDDLAVKFKHELDRKTPLVIYSSP